MRYSYNLAAVTMILALSPASAQVAMAQEGGDMPSVITAAGTEAKYVPVPGFPRGADLSILNGNPATGAFEMFFRLQPGVTVPMHFHTSAERTVGIQGTITMTYTDGSTMDITPGSYMFIPWKMPHAASCLEGEPCIFYAYFDKAFDVTWVADPPEDPNPMPDEAG